MIKETIRNIFKFLEKEENRKTPIVWKILNNEPIEQDDLIVNGDINMEYSDVESLPEGLYVNGDLSLFGSEIKSLPKDLYVSENLYLGYCDNITSLPEGLEVGGSLWLIESWGLKSLPKGLHVGGNLYIFKTNFTKFSDDEIRDMIKPGFIGGKIYRT
jgi:hypothetical protein